MLFLDKILYVIVLWKKKKPKTAQSRFEGGPPVKIPLRGHKIHVFWRGFPGKIRIAGAKNHVIGFASTRGNEKQPAVTDFKVSQFRGKTADLATWVEVTYFLFESGAPLAHGLQPDPSQNVWFFSNWLMLTSQHCSHAYQSRDNQSEHSFLWSEGKTP